MNRIEFACELGQGWDEPVIRILIDGRNLIEVIKEVEFPLADAEGSADIAGAYAGLPMSQLVPPSRVLFGDLGAGRISDKVPLLGCAGCGEEGCWPLLARISIDGDRVIWSDFEQPYRQKWDLSSIGPFTFDRKEYESGIDGLKKKGSV